MRPLITACLVLSSCGSMTDEARARLDTKLCPGSTREGASAIENDARCGAGAAVQILANGPVAIGRGLVRLADRNGRAQYVNENTGQILTARIRRCPGPDCPKVEAHLCDGTACQQTEAPAASLKGQPFSHGHTLGNGEDPFAVRPSDTGWVPSRASLDKIERR